MSKMIDIWTEVVAIQDPTKLTFNVNVPPNAEFLRAEYTLGMSQLLVDVKGAGGRHAFPVLIFHYEYEPQTPSAETEFKAERTYTIIPRGKRTELPEGSKRVCLLFEPPHAPGQPQQPLIIYELPKEPALVA